MQLRSATVTPAATTAGGGGTVAFGGKHLLFASQMGGKCPLLGHWSRVSEVVRLVGDAPNGPFDIVKEVVLPSFAHNVKPLRAPDGTWLLYFIGASNNDSTVCANSTAAALRCQRCAATGSARDRWADHGCLGIPAGRPPEGMGGTWAPH